MARHGKQHKRRRGCHKRDTSPEVVRWKEEHLLSDRPAYMDAPTYVALARLHRVLLADRP